MRRKFLLAQLHLLLFFAISKLLAQGPMVVEPGYFPPTFFPLAPGQVVTLFVSGVGLVPKTVADRIPLPTQLAGISVTLTQSTLPNPVPLPLFAVERVPGNDNLTAVTAQIPFEMQVRRGDGRVETLIAELVVSKDGLRGPSLTILPVTTSIRVLTGCDLEPRRFLDPLFRPILLCEPLVYHADGSQVTSRRPARPGEVLVLYAFGLGVTEPRVRTGGASTVPVPIEPTNWALDFEFRPNALPKRIVPLPRPLDEARIPRPVYVGLVPGFVGLYQVNFKVPEEIPQGTPSCETRNLSGLYSNLTVTLSGLVPGLSSSDGAAICVEVPNPTAGQSAFRNTGTTGSGTRKPH